MIEPTQNIPRQDWGKVEDTTAPLAFEHAADNTIQVSMNQCNRCLRPFGLKTHKSNRIRVWTALGEQYWCEECKDLGVEQKLCHQWRKLSKKERKWLKRYAKNN